MTEQIAGWPPRCEAGDPHTGRDCPETAEVHALVFAGRAGNVFPVAVCGPDAAVLDKAGLIFQQHEFRDCCGMPGTTWDRELNECVIDESGIEPLSRAGALAHA